ncbi:GNAT family N-acetyltransferase [uncultured Streptomyces sp.]|uniref:GNAT family N-acetyltransferase n=1 Tax=uncultured Streptomyces sp. TaxID=174707 RepID=UPI00260BC9D3|nr:GNAT family N-acetyltransferase [uncultured Streptomyces sp.]
MSLVPRTVTPPEFRDWFRAKRVGFAHPTGESEEESAVRLAHVDLSRVQGVFDEGRCVATFRSFAQELTVPGGARLPVSAITAVTVSPSHRRRGLLGRMMAEDLAAAKERGEVLATLIAAEYPIYGRFGFGPATSVVEWEADVLRTGLDPHARVPAEGDGGRVDLVDGEEVREAGPGLHDRIAASRHGVIDRPERWWELRTGISVPAHEEWTQPFHAQYRSASGEIEGLATYRVEDRWGDGKQPMCTVVVRDLLAATPAAERALWHFLCSIDWVTRVRTGFRAPDDLFPLLFPDPRAARVVTAADWLWLRVLDIPAALEARTYVCPVTLVLQVDDPDGPADGRFLLAAGPDAVTCTPTVRDPDLTLGAAELARLYLGDESVERLVALGTVQEHRPGAAAEADAAFRTGRRPWCPDVF